MLPSPRTISLAGLLSLVAMRTVIGASFRRGMEAMLLPEVVVARSVDEQAVFRPLFADRDLYEQDGLVRRSPQGTKQTTTVGNMGNFGNGNKQMTGPTQIKQTVDIKQVSKGNSFDMKQQMNSPISVKPTNNMPTATKQTYGLQNNNNNKMKQTYGTQQNNNNNGGQKNITQPSPNNNKPYISTLNPKDKAALKSFCADTASEEYLGNTQLLFTSNNYNGQNQDQVQATLSKQCYDYQDKVEPQYSDAVNGYFDKGKTQPKVLGTFSGGRVPGQKDVYAVSCEINKISTPAYYGNEQQKARLTQQTNVNGKAPVFTDRFIKSINAGLYKGDGSYCQGATNG